MFSKLQGISCADATFATQEALLTHLREGGHPYLCLFDLEKASNSIEFPVLLGHLFDIGINGRCWRLIMSWYTNAKSKVHMNGVFSHSFPVNRGVKQGSILSPILFIIVIDVLLKQFRDEDVGLSVSGNFVGTC